MEKLPEFIANHPLLIVLFVAILAMLLWNLFGAAMTGVRQIDNSELTRLVNRDQALVLDLRGRGEYERGHIVNARNLPAAELEGRMRELEAKKNLPLILCCAHGAESGRACRLLRTRGHEQVYALKGGIHGWRGANLPLVKERGKERGKDTSKGKDKSKRADKGKA